MGAPPFPFARPSVTEPPVEYARLRAQEPVSRVTTNSGEPAWLVTRYEDIRFVLSDLRFGVRAPGAAAATEDSLFQDPPGHTRLRRLVSKAFTVRGVEALRPKVQDLAKRLAGDLAAAGPPADLVEIFAFPMSIGVITELLGVPVVDQADFRRWSEAILSLDAFSQEEVMAAGKSLDEYCAGLIADKQRNPGPDLLSDLISVREEDNDRLNERELLTMAESILIAGYVTAGNTIGLGALTLLTHPQDYLDLVEDPSLVPGAIEEILRYASEIGGLVRIAQEDVRIGEVLIKAGDTVIAPPACANRDEQRFPDSGRFDRTRPANLHLAFGHGVHHCLGAAVGRLELQEAFTALTQTFPTLRLAVPVAELPQRAGLLDQGPSALPVAW
ncbi:MULTISPECIES: cytochrome P450 [unclassified Crossiella]|uniref:cytochrome P450 n=1 Tax=unclassified Crossiella TaxID=2620835 RepID=UPI0020000497|nr:MULTISPECIES: cytochrome P450 [unclassified Crossiella]MCK2239290.1 cytochrome P450 [Crossiella sp. S99.2]MCK2251140.1 cytochrome P450 [Crossiella sp. S99.1]